MAVFIIVKNIFLKYRSRCKIEQIEEFQDFILYRQDFILLFQDFILYRQVTCLYKSRLFLLTVRVQSKFFEEICMFYGKMITEINLSVKNAAFAILEFRNDVWLVIFSSLPIHMLSF